MDDWFNRPLETWRPASASDGAGGETESLGKVAREPLAAKVDQPSAKDQVYAAQNSAELSHVIYFDGVADVRRGDQLCDPGAHPDDPDTDPAATGDVFRVFAVVRPSQPVYTKAFATIDQFEES